MSPDSEKKFNLAGFRVSVATDAERADRIRRSLLYRYVLKPGMRLVNGKSNGTENGRRPAMISARPRPAEARPADAKAAEIWDKVSKLKWYHTIDVAPGVSTNGFIDNRSTAHLFGLPEDMSGMRCLDIGTYDGFWAFEMERRGAAEVIGIDVDSPADHDLPRRVKQQAIDEDEALRREWDEGLASVGLQFPGEGFRVAKEVLGSKARRESLNVYDLTPEKLGMFDVVLISQLLLRLRDPQTVIENMFSVTRGFAIIAEGYDAELEALDRPASEFIGTTSLGVWWGHSIKSMKLMMEVAGFDPVEEVSRFNAENRAGKFTKVVLKGHAPSAKSEAKS